MNIHNYETPGQLIDVLNMLRDNVKLLMVDILTDDGEHLKLVANDLEWVYDPTNIPKITKICRDIMTTKVSDEELQKSLEFIERYAKENI